MRIGQEAMVAALEQLGELRYSTKLVSMYESFLAARWLETANRYPDPSIGDSNEAVNALFVVAAGDALGRLGPFRWEWKSGQDSGRKTVWNNTTRGTKLATTIFQPRPPGQAGAPGDIRGGLRSNAADLLAAELQALPVPGWQALAALILRNHQFAPGDDWQVARAKLLGTLGLSGTELDKITNSTPVGQPLLGAVEWSVGALPEALAPPTTVTINSPSAPADQPDAPTETVTIDARVERMLLRGIERFNCVLLIGPPGSGKGMLVRWLTEKVQSDPTALGFSAGFDPNPMWRTPDEGWSAFELIGGLAPDASGELRWSHGLLVAALSEDRWLVLDETNRADMDKIMGPLLTWLSAQRVEIGRTLAFGGEPVEIGWTNTPKSQQLHDADLDTDAVADADVERDPRVFLAGTDWRLIGTYNPQDAQRVFRFGQALSRRFVTIPVPAIDPGQFESVLANRFGDLPDELLQPIVGLYRAHHDDETTRLGPAVFLRMAEYLRGADGDTAELIAEAYVLNVGKYLSGFEDAVFETLGTLITGDEEILDTDQWTWIDQQRHTLG